MHPERLALPLTARLLFDYCSTDSRMSVDVVCEKRGEACMPVLIRKYKLTSGLMQVERIDDPDRIERYMRIFEKDDVKKLQTGAKVFIEKDEWQLLP